MSENILKEEERIVAKLRLLYRKYGYQPYKMSKFEEYDLYVENKEFLVGDGVITFNDTDGKLLALKPDVTLSIIRNSVDDGEKRKVYYDENVYRISGKTKQFKEIMQVGLECIGDIGIYEVYETLCLAAASLAVISENYVLDISHLGLLSAILADMKCGEGFERAFMNCLAAKNAHGICSLCEEYNVSEENKDKLLVLVKAYGAPEKVLAQIAPFCKSGKAKEKYKRIQTLCKLLALSPYADKIRLDFSVVNDMTYYDNIVFKGFIDGIAEGVLSGGRYDKLIAKMGRNSGAIGFAVNLDLLEGFHSKPQVQDVDILVLYDDKTSPLQLIRAVNSLVKKGNSVNVQKTEGNIRYGKLVDMTGGKA